MKLARREFLKRFLFGSAGLALYAGTVLQTDKELHAPEEESAFSSPGRQAVTLYGFWPMSWYGPRKPRPVLDDGAYHDCTWVWKDNRLTFYIDGVEVWAQTKIELSLTNSLLLALKGRDYESSMPDITVEAQVNMYSWFVSPPWDRV
jgi:hypothetical protein